MSLFLLVDNELLGQLAVKKKTIPNDYRNKWFIQARATSLSLNVCSNRLWKSRGGPAMKNAQHTTEKKCVIPTFKNTDVEVLANTV